MRLMKTVITWLACVLFMSVLAAVSVEEKAGLTDIIVSSGFAVLFYLRVVDDISEYYINSDDIPKLRKNILGFIKEISFYIFTLSVGCVPIIAVIPTFAEYYIYLTMILLMLNIILSIIPEKKSKVKNK